MPSAITNTRIPAKYDVTTMTLREAISVLLDHCMTFEQVREMTFEQLGEQFERINAGELKTWAQHEAEKKRKRDDAMRKGKST